MTMITGNLDRRLFLRDLLSAGVLLLASDLVSAVSAIGPSDCCEELAAMPFEPSVFLGIEVSGAVRIVAHRSEVGSGSRTALPRVLADELEADWSRVFITQAIGDESYGSQDSEASRSIRQFFDVMREIGATARTMLVRAAAEQWEVPAHECEARFHSVMHLKSGRKLGYGALATAAARQPLPNKAELQLKLPSQWRYIGKDASSYDLERICQGNAIFGIDVRMDGMVYAVIQRPPVLGSFPAAIDASETLKVAGVLDCLALDPIRYPYGSQALGGVAVIGRSTWHAIKGRRLLKIKWSSSPHQGYNSDEYRRKLGETVAATGRVIRNKGDVDAEFSKAAKVVQRDYYVPHLAHATMETPAAVAHVQNNRVVIWASTQNPQAVQEDIATLLGIGKHSVKCHVPLLGDGFGRKSYSDFALEATILSKKVGKPVKVFWTREDDIRHDYYHPASIVRIKAALDNGGFPRAWLQRAVFPPIASNYDANAEYGLDWELGTGLTNEQFAIPNYRAENGPAVAHVRVGILRSVSNIHNLFAVYSFVDELAALAGRDSLEYLLGLIGSDRIETSASKQYPFETGRLRQVTEIVAEKS